MQEKKRVPKLRFPEFTGEWESKKIIDIADYVDYRGKTPTKTSDGVFLVTAKNIKNGKIDYEISKEYISNNDYEEVMRRGKPKLGDVLITTEAPLGEIAYIDNENIALAQRVIKYRAKNQKAENFYLKHLFTSNFFQKKLEKNSSGQTVKGIKGSILHQIKINIPSLPEQEKIASFLSKVDEKIEKLERNKELWEEYKKGVMQKIFSREIRFKDDEGQEFCEWEEKRLGEVGKFVSGKGFPEKEQGGLEGIPFYKVSDMNLPENKIEMNISNNYVTNNQISKLKLNVTKKKSIIFAKVGAAIFLERKRIAENYIIDNNMMGYIPKGNLDFFIQLFMKIRLSKMAQVGALPSYNSSDIGSIKIKLPSLPEQEKISNFLSNLDTKIDVLEREIERNKEFKKGLLQQMFV